MTDKVRVITIPGMGDFVDLSFRHEDCEPEHSSELEKLMFSKGLYQGREIAKRLGLTKKSVGLRCAEAFAYELGIDCTPEQIAAKGRIFWLRAPNFGKACLDYTTEWLKGFGLSWADDPPPVDRTPHDLKTLARLVKRYGVEWVCDNARA